MTILCTAWKTIALSALLFACGSEANTEDATPASGQGAIDVATQSTDHELTITGWAGATNSNATPIEISIRLGPSLIYVGQFKKLDRPDVVNALGRTDWLHSGWSTTIDIPNSIGPGTYPLVVVMRTSVGEMFRLSNGAGTASIEIATNQNSHRTTVRIALIGLIVITFLGIYARSKIADYFRHRLAMILPSWAVPAALILSIFFTLVGLGITGSSVNLGLRSSPAVSGETANIVGSDRPIRSDEWLAQTPMAIAQYNHAPKFPVINKNLGPDGQNMLIVGGVGQPVAHVSALVKPATWGFFCFDLRRALAWYWWFPIFGCFFALWSVFTIGFKWSHRLSATLAAAFVFSPYVTAWSLWPANAIFFPAAALTSVLIIFQTKYRWRAYLATAALGLSLAGFVLILYPPWQVTLGYLFLIVFVALVLRERLYSYLTAFKLGCLGIALLLCAFICLEWWSDAKDAIAAISATIYPGQRSAVLGGDIDPWYLISGITNFSTMYGELGASSNQSEVASFIYLWVPLLASFAYISYRSKKIDPIAAGLVAFFVFTTFYQFIGIPLTLSKLTLWGRVIARRADLALGIAHIMLIGSVLSAAKHSSINRRETAILGIAASSLWLLILLYGFSHSPLDITVNIKITALVCALLMTAATGYCLICNHVRAFTALYLGWELVVIARFNPITLAPTMVQQNLIPNAPGPSRVLVVGTQIPAMSLLAAGVPVLNGVFYYPQPTIWKTLDPEDTMLSVHNRYQHLLFVPGLVAQGSYRADTPQTDVVQVTIDARTFDFTKLNIRYVYMPQSAAEAFAQNTSIDKLSSAHDWSLFQVHKASITN